MNDPKVGPPVQKHDPAYIEQALGEIIKNEDFLSYDVTKTRLITKGGNYLAILYEVEVKGKTKNGDKEMYLFVKQRPTSELVSFHSYENLYERESYAYTELFKIYEEIQDSANIPDKERFKAIKCFYGSNTAIILENMTNKRYKTLGRMEVISLEFAELSVKQLAKLHGLSIVLQKQRPDYFNTKVKPLMMPMNMDVYYQILKVAIDITNRQLSEKSKERFTISLDTIKHYFNKRLISESFKCLCHGDLKHLNLLYSDQGCGIKEVIVIDYQMIAYGCPMDDLITLIFVGTDRDFRSKHMEHLKNLYHESLELFLNNFQINLNEVWPKEQFEIQYRDSFTFGLIKAVLILPFQFANEADMPNIESGETPNLMEFEPDIRVIDRLQGIVDDYIEWGMFSSSDYVDSPVTWW